MLPAKDVRKLILEENLTWKVPERRVVKFMKQYKKGVLRETDDSCTNHSSSSRSSLAHRMAKGTSKRLKRLIGIKSTTSQLSAPNTVILPPLKLDSPKATDDVLPTMTADQIARSGGLPEKTYNRSLAYADDNDGKKEKRLCEPCEGCLIL